MRVAAESEFLDVSTWARRILLQAVSKQEEKRAARLRVAEGENRYTGKTRDGK